MTQHAQAFQTTIQTAVSLKYLLYLPPGYEQQAQWPLILFLHGRGERGDDLDLVKKIGLAKNIEQGEDYPFIIVSPQCPASSFWIEEVEALNALLDHILATYAADPQRVYLTGLSMGGAGTWALATRYPQRFAAIAPICGSGVRWIAHERLLGVPTWVFHGDADSVVPFDRSQEMVDVLRAHGGNVRFTVYPGVDHDSWTATYANPELYRWFLSHTRQET